MKIFIILFILASYTVYSDYEPTDESRSGLMINFDFHTGMPISKSLDTYATNAGMSIGYMLNDAILFNIGYEGLLNKNIVREITPNSTSENAVFYNSFYYAGLAYKLNINKRLGISMGLKAGLSNFWFEPPYADSNGEVINLDLGTSQVMTLVPEINIYYRVREWLDASLNIGYQLQSNFSYTYQDVFDINNTDCSNPYWGLSLHFGFY